jgi:hypothetical protein
MIQIDGVKYVTEKEISARYGLSVEWFRKARYSDKGLPYRKLKRNVFYDINDVDKWFKDNLKTIN